jgi:reactive chlorine resistance protein C
MSTTAISRSVSLTTTPDLVVVTDASARFLSRWGLVAILFGLGAYKFTAVEAAAIEPLVANSPFMSWLYAITSVQGASNLIGVAEIVIGALLAAHRFAPRAAVAGGLAACGMFLVTLSFLVTTPGVLANVDASGFLVKDLFLLAAALVATTESLRTMTSE